MRKIRRPGPHARVPGLVVCQVWYEVGSSYEHEGITGVSHALEHMMCQGHRGAVVFLDDELEPVVERELMDLGP